MPDLNVDERAEAGQGRLPAICEDVDCDLLALADQAGPDSQQCLIGGGLRDRQGSGLRCALKDLNDATADIELESADDKLQDTDTSEPGGRSLVTLARLLSACRRTSGRPSAK